MKKKLGVVMDALSTIHYKKDSTLAMLWEASARDFKIYYFEQKNLFLQDGVSYGDARILKLAKDPQHFFEFIGEEKIALADLDVILMRKDPPFNEAYIYTTYILEKAEEAGTLVVNRPQALRDANEKMIIADFPQCCPPMLVSQATAKLREFWQAHGEIVCKPLNTMGGKSVFRLTKNDFNGNTIFETLTHDGKEFVMAQKFIPEITAGDKRVILINGEPVPHMLVRIPEANDWRGNLAVGAKGVVQAITERERLICEQLRSMLQKRGLYFVGIDIIGPYLTEVNVTSPTCIREIDAATESNISATLFDFLESKLT